MFSAYFSGEHIYAVVAGRCFEAAYDETCSFFIAVVEQLKTVHFVFSEKIGDNSYRLLLAVHVVFAAYYQFYVVIKIRGEFRCIAGVQRGDDFSRKTGCLCRNSLSEQSEKRLRMLISVLFSLIFLVFTFQNSCFYLKILQYLHDDNNQPCKGINN